ncbi:MAG: hypothetical protein GXO26_03510 [Crenarchaeota archaeon]|nr:hypothetical protein [Thermoproteota archaeon]
MDREELWKLFLEWSKEENILKYMSDSYTLRKMFKNFQKWLKDKKNIELTYEEIEKKILEKISEEMRKDYEDFIKRGRRVQALRFSDLFRRS